MEYVLWFSNNYINVIKHVFWTYYNIFSNCGLLTTVYNNCNYEYNRGLLISKPDIHFWARAFYWPVKDSRSVFKSFLKPMLFIKFPQGIIFIRLVNAIDTIYIWQYETRGTRHLMTNRWNLGGQISMLFQRKRIPHIIKSILVHGHMGETSVMD